MSLVSVLTFAIRFVTCQNSSTINSRIWSSSVASQYTDCYPIGNGRIGGMIIGDPQADTIHVNEESFWSGSYFDRVNQDSPKYMGRLQELIREGHISEASTLAGFTYAATPVSTRHYEALGDISLTMNHSSDYTNYERWLDLADATSGITYVNDGITYAREYLASNPSGVLAIKIAASEVGKVSFTVHVQKGESLNRWEDYSKAFSGNRIVMGGGNRGIEFAAGATVAATNGKVYTLGDTIICEGADEAWIYFAAWTSYRKPDPLEAVLSDLASISSTAYSSVRSLHVSDYQNLYTRVNLDFGQSTASIKSLQTSDRFSALNTTGVFDPELAALFFQYGRYILISTSRNGTLPANLQGLWTISLDPEWGSKYTVNINLGRFEIEFITKFSTANILVEMNYWPSLVTSIDSEVQI